MAKQTTPTEDLANVERAMRELQHRVVVTENQVNPPPLFGMYLDWPTFVFAVIGCVVTIAVVGLPLGQAIYKFWLG